MPFLLGAEELRVSAKVGIAMFPEDGADAETLFKNAEAALNKAKESNEPYLFYTQKLTERVADRLSLENQLRQALEKTNSSSTTSRRSRPRPGASWGRGADPLDEPGAGLVPRSNSSRCSRRRGSFSKSASGRSAGRARPRLLTENAPRARASRSTSRRSSCAGRISSRS